MKKTNLIRLLVLMMVLITGVTQVKAKTVYFYNHSSWTASNVKCHHWTPSGTSTTWPGDVMKRIGTTNMYYLDIGDHTKCIFNNNGSNQTGDLDAQDGKYYRNGSWYEFNVAGTNPFCSAEWDTDGDLMTNGVKTFKNVPAGTYKFKITSNNSWDFNIGHDFYNSSISSGVTESNSEGNVQIVTNATKDITISIVAGKIKVVATSVVTNTLTVSAGTGISAVTGTTNNITAGQNIAITATVASGYTWSTWTKTGTGTLSTFTAGTKNQTVTVGTAANMTLTASATENMTTVTINVSPASSGTLTVGGAAFTPGNTTTAGVSTSRTVVATAANSDYTFNNWTKTGNAAGSASTNTYTLKGNGSGSTGTLTANFTLTPCSLWYSSNQLYKGSSGTKTPMSYDTSEEAYYIDVTTNSSPYYFRFYHNNSKEYSCDWSTYPAGKEVVANGSKVDVDKDVTDWGDHSACYFNGTSGSSIRIWFDYQNKKAWITEPGYSVTINNGDHGTVSPNGVRSVGASGLTITATPTEGYKLASWSVTGGAHVASSTAATTTLTATADGTVTAIYETESPIRLYYSNPAGWSTIYAYLWDVDNTSDKNANWPGTAITTKTELVDCQQFYYYEYYPSAHVGWDRIIFNGGNSSMQTHNLSFNAATNAGQYQNAGKDEDGSWQDPTNPWYFAYDGDSYNTTAHPLTCTSATSGYVELDLAANTDYAFKFVENGSTWYGCTEATKITYENKATAQTMNNTTGGSADQTIKTAGAGTYRFTWDITNKRVTVTYPTSYKVELEVGTVKGNARTPKIYLGSTSSESNVISSGSYVAAGSKVIFWIANDAGSAPAAGYNWWGFYNNAAGTGSGLPEKYTDNTVSVYTINSIAANAHVYAVFGEINYWITPYINGQGSISPNGANAHIATPTEFTANPGTGYKFDSWEERGGSAMTIESPSVATTNVTTTAAATLQANFSPRWSVIGTGAFGGWSAYNTNLFTGYTVVSTKNVGYKSITLAANTSYEIKVYDRLTSTTYGGSAVQTIDYAHSGAVNEYTVATTASPKSVFIQSAAGGSYTLNWNLTDKKIAVVYPTSWYITTGQKTTGQADNAGGSFTAVDNNSNNVYGGKFVANNATVTFTATPNTGYNFVGWYSDASCETAYVNGTGGAAISGAGGVVLTLSSITADKTVYAKFTPKTYTITLTRTGTGYGSGGDATLTATYGAAFPAATMPTAAEGYAFMGYYSEANGAGTQFTNASGVLLANITDYSDEDGNWIYDDDVELFAYFKKAEITELALDAAVVQPNATVGVTPTIEPTPTPSTIICWKVLHGNGNPLDAQPAFTWNGTKLTFAASPTSGTYLIQAVLRTGSVCGSGTVLDSVTAPFQVAGDHVVTVQYKCGDEFIKASTTVTGKPLQWTQITAPDIVGYSFSKWKAGDGITIEGADGNGEKASATINFKAIYEGKLTAIYTAKRMIYFNNTLGWSGVTVYFYKNASYWDNTNGTGADPTYNFTNKPYEAGKHGDMTQIEGTNIWYYDLEANNVDASLTTVNFTEINQDGFGFFAKTGDVKNKVAHPCDGAAAFNSGLRMYVPINADEQDMNGGQATYYFKGYWMHYPNYSGYTLKIYSSDSRGAGGTTYNNDEIKSFDLPHSASFTMPISIDVDLEANTKYYFDVYRNDYTYFGNNGDMKSGNSSGWSFFNTDTRRAGLQTTAAGSYKFNWTFYKGSGGYNYYMTVTYPVATNDYRIYYTDNATWSGEEHVKNSWYHPSGVITKNTDASATKYDTVSFFISKDNSPAMKFQYASAINASTGKVTWSDVASGSITIPSAVVTESGVYNFIVKQVGTANPVIEKVEKYDGEYYIRTDCANSKWDNYDTDPDHRMTYSEYSITHGGYSHYYCHWVKHTDTGRKNVKFVIANDYSPCISDTLTRETASGEWANIGSFITTGGDLLRDANVRFMWNQSTNKISRAYVDGAQGDDSNNFLKMLSADGKITDLSGETLTEVKFQDNENWIYEANIQAQPNAEFKLISNWGTGPVITQYFKGTSSSYETLITGSGTTFYTIRVLYDFKTNRLIAALLPSGDIDDPMPINADVMFIREHQGDINQVILTEDGTITNIKTAYGVVRFNKWTINNKSKEGGHDPLTTPASIYERSLYWVSFPFRVKLSEVFGFGTYGTHWIIQYYDGAARAQKGMWAETGTYWKFVWDRRDFFLEPNTGYLLTVETDLMGEESGIWGPESRSEQVELFFPSYGTMPNITQADVTMNLEAHTCTIDRTGEGLPGGNDYRTTYDRRIVDSHWNVMGVPTYINTDDVTFPSNTWTTTSRPNFLYTWNMDDNTITATSASKFTFHAMHAYMVQCYGDVTWSAHSGSPYPIVARSTYSEAPKAAEFCLELQQNEKMIDRTFIKLSDDEDVSEGFAFNEDMTKEFSGNKSAIYTFIAGDVVAAGNTLPMTDQKTIVPVGVETKAAGTYTISIPAGTAGIGVTLIDEETGIRTNLSALDYTVDLSAGKHDSRFWLEISPVKGAETGIDPGVDARENGVRKVMIDGILYIVKDGKLFDARGARVE